MKIMFIVYHDIQTEARSQEILECAEQLGETCLVSYSRPIDNRDIKIIQTGNGKRNYWKFILTAIKSIKSERPKVVILHDNYTAILLKWIKKYYKDIYVIYDSSELYIDKKAENLKQKIAGFMNYYEKKYINTSDIVISANIERAKIMKEYFKLKEDPIIFDNIHCIKDEYNEKLCNEKYFNYFYDNKFVIVYAGGISKQRMTYELAKAVGDLGNEYRLIVLGSASDDEKKLFSKFLKEKRYNNINFIGFVPRNELRYFLNRSNVSVSAFAQDTINNINCASGKLFESLFEGTPVLTTENPPLKRICSDYGVGVSTNDFRTGILELKNNYKIYKDNVYRYSKNINVDNRIDILVKKIKYKLKLDGVSNI